MGELFRSAIALDRLGSGTVSLPKPDGAATESKKRYGTFGAL